MPRPDTSLRARTAAVLILAAALAVQTLPAAGADPAPDIRLKQLEREMKKGEAESETIRRKADALAREQTQIRKEMVAAARAVQEHEDKLSELEIQLEDLGLLEREKTAALDWKRQQMNGVLTALQRLAVRPPEALIVQPSPPADTVRSAILLRSAVPTIAEQAASLRAEIDTLTTLRSDIGQQKERIAIQTKKRDEEHRRLTALHERKQQLQKDTEEQRAESERRLKAMAGEAADLKDLLARLDAEKKRAEAERIQREKERKAAMAKNQAGKPGRDEDTSSRSSLSDTAFSRAKGQMPFPARGRVVASFGQKDNTGQDSRGISIATRDGAQVIAPSNGQILFAGPFRGYGLLLIIEHGEGYHTLLAGMAHIDGAVGQHVIAGEPVGVMGQAGGSPLLYVELRHHGQPVNPLPWLSAQKNKG